MYPEIWFVPGNSYPHDRSNQTTRVLQHRLVVERNSDRFDEAIAEIDKTMQHLQKVRDALVTSGNHLGKANTQAADLTIKRLTKGNPTMAQKFAELKEK